MKASKLAKNIWEYLPLLAVVAVAVTGMLIAKDLYQTSLDSQVISATQFTAEQNSSLQAKQRDPQLMILSETAGKCISPLIYTSLPPKCRTSDGTFIQLPGTSLDLFVIPKGK